MDVWEWLALSFFFFPAWVLDAVDASENTSHGNRWRSGAPSIKWVVCCSLKMTGTCYPLILKVPYHAHSGISLFSPQTVMGEALRNSLSKKNWKKNSSFAENKFSPLFAASCKTERLFHIAVQVVSESRGNSWLLASLTWERWKWEVSALMWHHKGLNSRIPYATTELNVFIHTEYNGTQSAILKPK